MAASSDSGKAIGIAAIVVGVVVVAAIVIVGTLATFAIYGVRRYLVNAKSMEGRMEVMRLAQAVRACTGLAQSLPGTTSPVPRSLAQVSGKKYLSDPNDWSETAYKCGAFSISTPQYFQYQWELVTPSTGRATAQADLDGDGVAEIRFEVPVTCAGSVCTTGPVAAP